MAKRLGEIAYLAFGSEYPDVDLFIKGRDILFSHALEQSLSNKIRMNPTLPYAVLREQCFYEQAEGFPSDFIRSPNCILGLSYMMALKNTSITPILFPRKQIGQEKHDGVSGQHVRRLIVEKQDGWQGFLSPQTKEILDHAEEQGRFPVVAKNVEKAMLYTLRNGDEGKIKTYYGCAPLASRICRAAKQAKSLEELYALVSAKQYPRARIRRAVLAAVLGIGEEEAKQEPECTVVLGANSKGREFLRQIKKTASVSIFTKPAHAVQSGKMLPSWLRAEALYSLAFPKPREEGWYMKTSPYLIEKESVQ
ncbi:MAG TPA: hypothetical protein DCY74_07335 [Clostridiales bacterium]|nr:hypothetical protein [Clostridiales bacterium]